MKNCHYLLLSFLVFFMLSGNAQSKTHSAEEHVKEFYQWYIGSGINITIDNDLTEYVDGCVLKSLRVMYDRSYFGSSYFTKSQDYWDEWLDVLIMHKEMKINNTTSIVPITFKFAEDKQHHLIVFVQKEMDGWRIIKIIGTDNFYE